MAKFGIAILFLRFEVIYKRKVLTSTAFEGNLWGEKTKKPVGLTGVFFIIIFAHPYSRLVLRSLGKGGRELLHGRRKPTTSQATARSDFTSKAKRRFEWRAAVAAWRCEVEPDGSVKWSLAASLFFCLQKKGKKMIEDFSNRKTSNAKTVVLKNVIENSGILHFFLF